MSIDRFILFPKKGPTFKEAESVIYNFFGGAAEVKWENDRWFISLAGVGTFPFVDVVDFRNPAIGRERWIEVFFNPLDIITRMQDEYTNVLARGLAEAFARFWEGKIYDS